MSFFTNIIKSFKKLFSSDKNNEQSMSRGNYIDGIQVPSDTGAGGSGISSLPTQETGTEISFDSSKIYNTNASAGTGNLTQDLTNAKLGIVQKIYHEDSSEPTFPSEWVLIGNAIYSVNELNIIYAEYVNANRIEYWIAQESD